MGCNRVAASTVVLGAVSCLLVSMGDAVNGCPKGKYHDYDTGRCEPCVHICAMGRGTQSLCEQHADECSPSPSPPPTSFSSTQKEFAIASSSLASQTLLDFGDSESKTTLVLGLVLGFVGLISLIVIVALINQRRSGNTNLFGFRSPKTKTVRAVHPVEEGNGQIHPSNYTPLTWISSPLPVQSTSQTTGFPMTKEATEQERERRTGRIFVLAMARN